MKKKLILLYGFICCFCLLGCSNKNDEILTPPESDNHEEELIIISSDNKELDESYLLSTRENLDINDTMSLRDIYLNYEYGKYDNISDKLTCVGSEEVCKDIMNEVEEDIPDDLEKILANSVDGIVIVAGEYSDFKSYMEGKPVDDRLKQKGITDYSGVATYENGHISIYAQAFEDVVVHELGHALDYTPYKFGCNGITVGNTWNNLYNSEYVSDYGRTNVAEYFAETFMYYFINQYDKLSQAPNTVNELENLIYSITEDVLTPPETTEDDVPEIEVIEDDEEDWYITDDGEELDGIPEDYVPEYEQGEDDSVGQPITAEQFNEIVSIVLNSGYYIKEYELTDNDVYFYFDSNDVTLKYACESTDSLIAMIRDYLVTNNINENSSTQSINFYFKDINPDYSYGGQNGFEFQIYGMESFETVALGIEEHYTSLLPVIIREYCGSFSASYGARVYPEVDNYGTIHFAIEMTLDDSSDILNIDTYGLANRILLENTGLDNYIYFNIYDDDLNLLDSISNDHEHLH